MLTSLRTQNFRSIRDASVKLGQVNLFIGPNNSGKSNFLKGIEVAAALLSNTNKDGNIGRNNLSKSLQNRPYDSPATVAFITGFRGNNGEEAIVTTALKDDTISQYIAASVKVLNNQGVINPELLDGQFQATPAEIRQATQGTIIYNINPENLRASAGLKNMLRPSADGADLVMFLFYLEQNYRAQAKRIQTDFRECIRDLVHVSTAPVPDEPGKLKLKFFDKNDVCYWAEEVSEGVLYFLALLCIVHQPDPPKLLLLEEPEKGIHPRRIKEVMDFIFELAELRGIQIILTSHSPYVVDHFADIPECISVFDRENDETVIRNAGDLISESNAQLAAEGKPPIRCTDSLGEHWVSGFLGGVPA
jgi:predicted ATPase